MLFNSLPFLLFLVLFLPTWLLLPRRFRNPFMLAGSYFFYGWWDWRFCGLLALSTVVDYFVGAALAKTSSPVKRKRLLLISLVSNLTILGTFKYLGFFLESFQALLESLGIRAGLPSLRIILPVGISFYTFQTLSYTIDIYRGKLRPTRNFIDFALFVAFFPQLVAGPIERAANLLPQLVKIPHPRPGDLAEGIKLITMGMIMKVLLGDQLAPLVDPVFRAPGAYTSLESLQALLYFSLQIYCDFSGYSLIARGTARIFGVDVMINFRQPYLALNITDFWRRWHISLSSWLKDYLYIPLGGNRKGKARTYYNLMVTMLLGGLWHGANWTFVVWGGLHGVYLAVHKLLLRGRKPETRIRIRGWKSAVWAFSRVAFTFVLVLLTWLFFRSPDFQTAFTMLSGILSFQGAFDAGILGTTLLVGGLVLGIDLLLYGLEREEILGLVPRIARPGVLAGVWVVILAHLIFAQEIPFIYFQF